MRSKIIAAIVAGGLLVGAGFISSAISAPGTASAQEESATEESRGFIARGLAFLEEVLDELVGEGTITQEDADAVLSAVETKAAEVRAERREIHELVQGFLEDGVITEAEAAQLPDEHWVFNEIFDEAWEDGQLTTEEIRETRPHPRHDAFRRGARLGALLDDGGIDQQEFDDLPDDHPLSQVNVSEYLEDGLITPEELREIWQDLKDSDSA